MTKLHATLHRQGDTITGHEAGENGRLLVLACRRLATAFGIKLRRGQSVDVELTARVTREPYDPDTEKERGWREMYEAERRTNIRLANVNMRLSEQVDALRKREIARDE